MNQEADKAQDGHTRLEQATEWFLRVRSEEARAEDLAQLKHWMESDPRNAQAYQQISATWNTIGGHASAPEIVVGRRDALDNARRAARQRWSQKSLPHSFSMLGEKVSEGRMRVFIAAAASILLAVLSSTAWYYTQRGVYATDLGERRTLTLRDGSVVTLDARSKIRVDYEDNERLIALEQGQARFDVAKDPTRPFRVKAGDQTVIALGTQFNVELVAGSVLVTMIEGHVAVLANTSRSEHINSSPDRGRPGGGSASALSPQPSTLELKAGEGLRVRADGMAVILPSIDIERATAWQSGKMFFNNEPLASAVERMNRYSRKQIQVAPSVAELGISGVFNAGDSAAFIEAVTEYFPVQVERTGTADIHLTAGP